MISWYKPVYCRNGVINTRDQITRISNSRDAKYKSNMLYIYVEYPIVDMHRYTPYPNKYITLFINI